MQKHYLGPTSLFALLVAHLLIAPGAHAQPKDAVPVSVARASHGPLVEEVPLTGSVTSPQSAVLSAAMAGLVAQVHLDVGARVQPGTTLIELDPELAQIDLANARAALESAEASLAEAQRRVDEAAPLVKQNNIAATEVRARESEAKIARAEVERARADLKRRQAELARHKVTAPFAGVISRKLTEVGEWVAPGNEVMELVATDNLRLDFQVPQNHYPRINEKAKVLARFDAEPERLYESRILSTVPVNNPNARTFLLRAVLNNADINITPGMSVQGVLQLHTDREGVLIPRDAIIRYADGRIVVWEVSQSGDTPVVQERVITIGLSAEGQVEVRSGLNAGALVVTRGNEALQPGQAVSITEPRRASSNAEQQNAE